MKYINELIKIIVVCIISILILSLLSYFNIINENTHNIIEKIILFIMLFISGLNLGKLKEKKGYMEGIIFGGIIIGLLLLLRLIFINKINLSNIIYYLLIIALTTTGSIFGINKKKNK